MGSIGCVLVSLCLPYVTQTNAQLHMLAGEKSLLTWLSLAPN